MEPLLNRPCVFCVVLMFLSVTVTATGRVIYVDDDATAANNGSTWQNAYRYLQDALAAANSAEKPVEIRVAQGIYKPDQGKNQTPGDREATFQLKNGVTIKGGYAGLGASDPNARDFAKHETILTGDLAGNDIDVSDTRDLLGEPSRAENTYHVVTGSGTDARASLDGFTVTGGAADGVATNQGGAGMYNAGGSPTIIGCTFTGNWAWFGGGISNHSGSPILSNCTFSRNHGEGGGGMRNVFGTPRLMTCSFVENSATLGGGIYNNPSSPTVINCVFTANYSSLDGGGISNTGGSKPVLANCIFTGNVAKTICIPISGFQIFTSPRLRQELRDYVFTTDLSLPDVWCGQGGGISNVNSSIILTNCTFAGNLSVDGNALSSVGPDPTGGSSDLRNCILWDGGNEIWVHKSSGIAVSYSDVQGGWPGQGNISADPCIIDAGRWEDRCDTPFKPSDDIWVDGDYHLKSQAGHWDPESQSWVRDDITSPSIDAGDPNSPIGHEPFPNGGRINMGAYGGTPEASKSYFGKPACETIVAGDINGDCKVDFTDFAIMASHWLEGR